MSTTTALRTTAELLHRIEQDLGTTPPAYITPREREAIRFLRDLAANTPARRPPE